MLRRFLLLAAASAMVLALAAPSPTEAAPPHGGLCTLQGSASFTPGLTVKPNKAVKYTFTGNLSNCAKGTLKAAPPTTGTTGGTVSASGSAVNPGIACEAGASKGTSTIHWNAGTTSAASFKTYSAGAVTLVQGKITSSTDPDVHAGDTTAGALVFQTSSPQSCAQGGLTSATFTGEVGTGNVK
jgi:hypothetical protein